MGTSLSGLTPATTFDALIKVTDNGPLTGSLKKLTDGLGNDSSLSLSTAAARITGNLTVQTTTERANITTDADLVTQNGIGVLSTSTSFGQGSQYIRFFNSAAAYVGSISQTSSTGIGLFSGASADLILGANSTERMRITSAGNVGIGTSAPGAMLTLKSVSPFIRIERDGVPHWQIQNNTLVNDAGFSINNLTNVGTAFFINGTTNNVGILTANPTQPLDVIGNIRTSTGILFGSDTAAANALDDYEEGTWTATDQSGAGLTFTTFNTSYTKIGNRVFFGGSITFPSTADASQIVIGGLPYTAATGSDNTGGVFISATNSGRSDTFLILRNTTNFVPETNAGLGVNNVSYSAKVIKFQGLYHVS